MSYEAIEKYLPEDNSDQYDVFKLMDSKRREIRRAGGKLLDLGCGTGDSHAKLIKLVKNLRYKGVDISTSPEVASRERSDLDFYEFDGVNLPFGNSEFDIVFCKQVLEHVRHPDQLLASVSRVLRPGGIFVGSVSCLEPLHSYSIFNWTAYGIPVVFQDHNILIQELRPGIDGISLTMRKIFGRQKFSSAFGKESMYNHYLEQENQKRDVRTRNFEKLSIAGHIIFWAIRQP